MGGVDLVIEVDTLIIKEIHTNHSHETNSLLSNQEQLMNHGIEI